jgi:hypothetical protein
MKGGIFAGPGSSREGFRKVSGKKIPVFFLFSTN